MLDGIRSRAFGALKSPLGNRVAPVRWTKGFWLLLNDAFGRPLASRDELEERRERERTRQAKLAEIRAQQAAEARRQAEEAQAGAKPREEAAPVVVYIDEKSMRDLKRIKQVLAGRDIPFKELDIEHDEAARSWVLTTAKAQELPIVFVAGAPVGGYDALVQADASGQLVKLVFGGV